MRIGIDAVSLGESIQIGGIGSNRFWLSALVTHLCREGPQHRFVLLTPTWADPLLTEMPSNLEICSVAGVPHNRSLRGVFLQTWLPVVINRAKLDCLFASSGVVPLAVKVPVVSNVLHIHFYTTPDAFGLIRTLYLRTLVRLSLRKATRVIISSSSSARDLSSYTGYPLDQIDVIPFGLSDEVWEEVARTRSPEDLSGFSLTDGRPYVLYVSATYPYKNHRQLIRAFARAKIDYALPHVLLLVGSEGGVSLQSLRDEATAAGIGNDVIVTGRVPRAIPLYHDADCSVMPSRYETFGFPVLESMALGCPVVTSNRGTMAEFACDAAVLVDPDDERALAASLGRLLSDASLQSTLREVGRTRAAPFRWTASAQQFLTVLEEAAQSKRR